MPPGWPLEKGKTGIEDEKVPQPLSDPDPRFRHVQCFVQTSRCASLPLNYNTPGGQYVLQRDKKRCADQIEKHMTYRERHLCDILKAFRRRRALVSRCETSKCQIGQDGALFRIHLRPQISFLCPVRPLSLHF